MASEDFLAYLKLEAQVYDDYTIHASHKRNRVTGALDKTETKWTRTKSLGQGGFAQIWLEQTSSPNENQQARAIKVIRKEQMKRLKVDYKKELLALATFSKKEYRQAEVLVSLLNWFEDDRSVFLAMEYFHHGDLAMHIQNISRENEVRQITTDLLEGLKIMHGEGFAHRDLKPQNIFVVEKPPLSPRWWVKLGDFGISKRVRNEETAMRTQIGTPYFQAPEVHGFVDCDEENAEYNNSIDIWSLGCVVYNISAQRLPFSKMSDINNFCLGRSQLLEEPLSRVLSKAGIEFIGSMIVAEPAHRTSVDQALQNPWVIDVMTPSLIQYDPVAVEVQGHLGTVPKEISVVAEPEQADHGHSDALLSQHTGRDRSSVAKVSHSENTAAAHVRMSETLLSGNVDATMALSSSPPTDVLQAESTANIEYSSPAVDIGGPSSEGRRTPLESRVVSSGIGWDQATALRGHQYEICHLAFSPDGTLLASASRDTSISVWYVETGQRYRELCGHKNWVTTVAFSPGGKQLASGSDDGAVRLWNFNIENIGRELFSLKGSIETMAFSPDGSLLVSGSGDGKIQLWDLANDQAYCELSSDVLPVMAVAFSSSTGLLASASMDASIRFWDINTRQVCHTLSSDNDWVNSLAFSADGTLLAAGSHHSEVQVWDVATGAVCHELLRHKVLDQSGTVGAVALSPSGRWAASGSNETIRLFNIVTKHIDYELYGADGLWVSTLAFSPGGTLLASGSRDGTIRILKAAPTTTLI